MKTIDLHQVDAFTRELFGGNPAAVVTNANDLTDDEMKKITREMNLSETAFVLSPTLSEADLKLRFFTPTGDEVKFCGHATVGTLFQLAKSGLFQLDKTGENTVRVETNVGVLSMVVVNEKDITKVAFTAPKVNLAPYRLQGVDFAKEFHISPALLKDGGEILLDTKLNYVYIPVSSLAALGDQTFDFAHIRDTFTAEGIIVFCLYTNETKDSQADLHARSLVPTIGIDEDPFTGSMQAGLVRAAKRAGLLATGQSHIVTEQGHFMGRPGSAEIDDKRDDELVVIASAVPVFSTKVEL
jgi:PhzF family phenazine biosynthesis protein